MEIMDPTQLIRPLFPHLVVRVRSLRTFRAHFVMLGLAGILMLLSLFLDLQYAIQHHDLAC